MPATLFQPELAARLHDNTEKLRALGADSSDVSRLVRGPIQVLEQLFKYSLPVLHTDPDATQAFQFALMKAHAYELNGKWPDDPEAGPLPDGSLQLEGLVQIGLAAIAALRQAQVPAAGLASVAALIRAATPATVLARVRDEEALSAFAEALSARRPDDTWQMARQRLLRQLVAVIPEEAARWQWVQRTFEGVDDTQRPLGLNALVRGPQALGPGQGGLLTPELTQLLTARQPLFVDAFEPLGAQPLEATPNARVTLTSLSSPKEKLLLWWVDAERGVHEASNEPVSFENRAAEVELPLAFESGRVAALRPSAMGRLSSVRTVVLQAIDQQGAALGLSAQRLSELWLDIVTGPVGPLPPSVSPRVSVASPVDDPPDSQDGDRPFEPGGAGSVVLIRPYVVSRTLDEATQQQVLEVQRATGGALFGSPGVRELPWLNDSLAVVQGPVRHDNHPAVASLFREVFLLAAKTPGLELATWLVLLPHTERELLVERSFPTAWRVVIASERAPLSRTDDVRPLEAGAAPSADGPSAGAVVGLHALATKQPALVPAALRLRVLARKDASGAIQLLSSVAERRSVLRVDGPLTPLEATSMDSAGEELSTEKLVACDTRRRTLIGAWVEVTDDADRVVLERVSEDGHATDERLLALRRKRGTVTVGSLEVTDSAGSPLAENGQTFLDSTGSSAPPEVPSNGQSVRWTATHSEGLPVRAELQVRLPQSDVWLAFAELGRCGRGQAPLHRLRGDVQLRLAVDDGWNQAVSGEQRLSDNRSQSAIRKVGAQLYFAELGPGRAFPFASPNAEERLVWTLQEQELPSHFSGHLVEVPREAAGPLQLILQRGSTQQLLDTLALGEAP